ITRGGKPLPGKVRHFRVKDVADLALYDRHVRALWKRAWPWKRGPGRGKGLVELTFLSDLEMSFFRRGSRALVVGKGWEGSGREKCSRFNNFFPRPPTLRRQQQQQQHERINAGPEVAASVAKSLMVANRAVEHPQDGGGLGCSIVRFATMLFFATSANAFNGLVGQRSLY
ncbi:hypothetical protein THAOC_11913, partial [Thalassiosira oceanica]